MSRRIDITGQKYGRLIVVGFIGIEGHHSKWNCKCDCGKEKAILATSLKSGRTLSCGCLQKEKLLEANTIHGKTNSPEWRSWAKMIRRCRDPRDNRFKSYAGRGITVCERWSQFDNFISDMGNKPTPKHSIDRVNNDLGYCPENCRWASHTQQARNTRKNRNITASGETKRVTEWAENSPVNAKTIFARIYAGWSPELAIKLPKYSRK